MKIMNKRKLITLTQSRYGDVVFAKPLKKISFPTVAHNYSFWADFIFAPKSREKGMLLIVEERAGGVGVILSGTRQQGT